MICSSVPEIWGSQCVSVKIVESYPFSVVNNQILVTFAYSWYLLFLKGDVWRINNVDSLYQDNYIEHSKYMVYFPHTMLADDFTPYQVLRTHSSIEISHEYEPVCSQGFL